MGSTYSQLTFSHIIYYICWLVLNLALLENWFLDSRRNEEHPYHLWTVAGWSAKLHGLEQFDQRYAAPVKSEEFFLPQAVKIPGWHSIIYSLFVFPRWAQSNSVFSSRWAQSNSMCSSRWAQSNNYKHVPKPLAQGTQQQIVRYTSPKATMLWTMCLDDISSCHRQCCLYCWCWVLKRFGIVCV